MAEIITATFQDGAFVPEQMPTLPSGTRVKLTIEPMELSPAQAAVAAHRRPTAEDIARFNAICDEIGNKVRGFKKMTRDELHVRD